MGLNEFAGYLAVSLAALASGYLAATYGPLPQPFYPGIAFAVLGLLLSLLFARDTRVHAEHEAATAAPSAGLPRRQQTPSFLQVVLLTSWKDRALFAACQAGAVNNLNDGVVWGLAPLFLAGAGLPISLVGVLAATYPGVWAVGQLATGALSDRWGRKGMIVLGMGVQALGIGLLAAGHGFGVWMGGMVLLGLGTAPGLPHLAGRCL
jgi:predicted MFS family arabinose efflux permease